MVIQAHLFDGIIHPVDDFHLVGFTARFEESASFRCWRPLLDDVIIPANQILHPLFQHLQIFRREGLIGINIVIETFLNHRSDRHFGIRAQLLDRMTDQVGAGMANNLQTFRVAGGNDCEVSIIDDGFTGIHQLAVHTTGQGGFGQTWTDIGSHVQNGQGAIVLALATIRKGNYGHQESLLLSVATRTKGRMRLNVLPADIMTVT